MVRSFLRVLAVLAAVAAFFAQATPAFADGGTGEAIAKGVVSGANLAIKNAERAHARKRLRHQAVPPGSVAQVPPIPQQRVGKAIGLPTGFSYTFDVSAATPYGEIGTMRKWLPGGMDASLGYGFNSSTRFVANYFEIQHYPAQFNSGTVPFYVQGLPNQLGCVDLGGLNAGGCAPISSQIDVTTKDKITLLMLEHLFTFKLPHDRVLPLVLTPTYVARTANIAGSGGNGDVIPFEYNGFPRYGVHTRTAQVYSIALTVPFLKTPQMFGTFTVAPSWLVHTAGVNGENKAQLYQILYLEYTPQPGTKIFFEPQSSRDYLPLDAYAQHLFAYFLGVSQMLTKNTFVQVTLNAGNPTNVSPYGVTGLYCQQAGNCANTTIPSVGGLKATQIQVQFGFGSPNVIQF